mgnify:CR=1 FL=1
MDTLSEIHLGHKTISFKEIVGTFIKIFEEGKDNLLPKFVGGLNLFISLLFMEKDR